MLCIGRGNEVRTRANNPEVVEKIGDACESEKDRRGGKKHIPLFEPVKYEREAIKK